MGLIKGDEHTSLNATSNNCTDLSHFAEILGEDSEEAYYILNAVIDLAQYGGDITTTINTTIEIINKLNKQGLTLYKDVLIDGNLTTAYKLTKQPEDI